MVLLKPFNKLSFVRGNIWEQIGVIPICCLSKCETFAEVDLRSPANFLAAESAVSWKNPWAVGRLLFCFLGIGVVYGYATDAA